MFICKRVTDLQQYLLTAKKQGKDIGFVPTMGALHEGHLSLVHASRAVTSCTVVSIFVNPKQFNDPADLEKYPRPISRDLQLLYDSGADVVFHPEVHDMYPPGDKTSIEFDPGPLAEPMEGLFRPGHFKGMAEVVYRLLEMVKPDRLFMGQKDFQQVAIVRAMIDYYKMPIELVMSPTMREPNGLAMSSRNVRLSESARERAGLISSVLQQGKIEMDNGKKFSEIRASAWQQLQNAGFEIDYFDIVNGHTLKALQDGEFPDYIVACCVIRLEGVRLLDNMIWRDNG